jgi:hypothetical protein
VKTFIKLPLFIVFICLTQISSAQYLASAFKPKNKTEKLVIAKVRALPEIKEWLQTNKPSKPDLIINLPDSPSGSTSISDTHFSIQVGISNFDMFTTSYYLYVDPKNLHVYYNDYFDESGSKLITLRLSIHKWKDGKLVVLKD